MLPALARAAPDPKVIQGCEDCHGANGVTTSQDIPTIAGVSAAVQKEALGNYRAKKRVCTNVHYTRGDTKRESDMCSVAKDLTDAQIADLSAYFAGKTFVAMKQPVDAAKAGAGKAIYTRDCKKCHSSDGSDPTDDAGILAGQPVTWLKNEIMAFKKGESPQEDKMKAVVAKLSDADIEALANFYGSKQ